MRTLVEKSVNSLHQSYTLKVLREPYFDPHWHFHPHYQLFTVLRGSGTRFIGDDIRHFGEGDTVFLGPDVPHLWRSDAAYFEKGSDRLTEGIVVYFKIDFLGTDFFAKPEMRGIQDFFQRSARGLDIVGDLREQVISDLRDMSTKQGFGGVLALLSLLHKIASSVECQEIASPGYTNTSKASETERLRQVYSYVLHHFQEPITLEEVSSLVHMSEAAFCRYFKSRTHKRFIDFVKEIRIGNACRLLQEDKLPIAEVAFQSGYSTLSNFNHQFRSLKGMGPREYRRLG